MKFLIYLYFKFKRISSNRFESLVRDSIFKYSYNKLQKDKKAVFKIPFGEEGLDVYDGYFITKSFIDFYLDCYYDRAKNNKVTEDILYCAKKIYDRWPERNNKYLLKMRNRILKDLKKLKIDHFLFHPGLENLYKMEDYFKYSGEEYMASRDLLVVHWYWFDNNGVPGPGERDLVNIITTIVFRLK